MDLVEEVKLCIKNDQCVISKNRENDKIIIVECYTVAGYQFAFAFDFTNFPNAAPPGFHIASMSDSCTLRKCDERDWRNLLVCQNPLLTASEPKLDWFYLSRPYSSNLKDQDWDQLPREKKNMHTYIEYIKSILHYCINMHLPS